MRFEQATSSLALFACNAPSTHSTAHRLATLAMIACWIHRLSNSISCGLIKYSKYLFMLKMLLTGTIAIVVITRNTPWKDKDMRNKGKWDKERDIRIKGNNHDCCHHSKQALTVAQLYHLHCHSHCPSHLPVIVKKTTFHWKQRNENFINFFYHIPHKFIEICNLVGQRHSIRCTEKCEYIFLWWTIQPKWLERERELSISNE